MSIDRRRLSIFDQATYTLPFVGCVGSIALWVFEGSPLFVAAALAFSAVMVRALRRIDADPTTPRKV
jgi:hypothetical protein